MRGRSGFIVLMLVAAAFAAAADEPLPEIINVRQGEVVSVPLGPAASFLLDKTILVEATRTKDGVNVRGILPGTVNAFVLDGDRSDAVTIHVEPGREVRRDVSLPVAGDIVPEDPRLRFSTGGWLTSGIVTAATYGASGQGFTTNALYANLSGDRPALSYNVSAVTTTQSGKVEQQNVQAKWRTPWGRGGFLSGISQLTEFTPLSTSVTSREAFMNLETSDVTLQLGARAPYENDRLTFAPEAARGYAEAHFGAASFGAGAIVGGLSGGQGAVLPFGEFALQGQSARASIFGGMVPGSKSPIAGARAQVGFGRCELAATYTTGLLGSAAADVRESLVDYVDPNLHSFRTNGTCRTGRWLVGLGAFRGGRTNSVVNGGDTILSGIAAWDQGSFGLQAYGSWNSTGRDDARNLGMVTLSKQLYGFDLGLSETASYLLKAWNLTETLSAMRRFGVSVLSVSGGTTHGLEKPEIFFANAGSRIDGTAFRASASVQATAVPHSEVAWNADAYLAWLPFPAYALQANTSMDLRQYRRWSLGLTFAYQFGDAMPREPLLAPLRRFDLEAVAFEDIDGNGKWDQGEPPLSGIDVCIEKECEVTGESGRFTVSGLSDGLRRVVASSTHVVGAVPTTEVEQIAPVGGYTRPTVVFGFRRTGEIILAAYFDANGNGKRDENEKAFEGAAQVTGPGLEASVPFNARGKAIYSRLGKFRIAPDLLTMPAGYLPPPELEVDIDGFRPVTIELPIRAIRSIRGQVCVDSNGDGRCNGELPVPNVHVLVAGNTAVTDEGGNYFFPDLPSGDLPVVIAPADLPPGTSQPGQTLKISERPLKYPLVITPLPVDVAAARDRVVQVAGQRMVEAGGLTFAASAVADGRIGPGEDKLFRKLLRISRTGGILLVRASADPVEYGGGAERALEQARQRAGLIGDWFKRRSRGVAPLIEAAAPAGPARIEIRVYRPAPPEPAAAPVN